MLQAVAQFGPLAGDDCPGAVAAAAVRDVECEYMGERVAELERWKASTTRPFVRRLARLRKDGSGGEDLQVPAPVCESGGVRGHCAEGRELTREANACGYPRSCLDCGCEMPDCVYMFLCASEDCNDCFCARCVYPGFQHR
ncbi:unnamed protein product [Prorocentrum cordatum]|uniref:Uncharacterized protein n=1 Tax=Prorocentrum cordatum TaxID=2364126 RepID=A0ABN9XD56_9DINO|nr:unnamed protein product [Polarella glacialis]